MTSIRYRLLRELRDRLLTIEGWDVQLRLLENTSTQTVKAVVFAASEDKSLANIQLYDATLQVGVLLTAFAADADPVVDDGDPYHYLDRLVVAAERAISTPQEWTTDPSLRWTIGHEVRDPTEGGGLVEALLRLTFTYRHLIEDPEL